MPHSLVDWLSREGTEAFKARIEHYWREQGYHVTVVLKDAGFHPAVRAVRFDVRSDLVNGLPRSPREPSAARNGAPPGSTQQRQRDDPQAYALCGCGAECSPDKNLELADQESEPTMSADAGDAREAEELRVRACALADTARYNHWEDIGVALEAEGLLSASTTIGADVVLRRMLNARCALAKSKNS